MIAGFLMIVLTALESGQMSAAFVNTGTMEECEQRAATVRTILEQGNIGIVDMVCRSSDAAFEPFTHGAEADAERFAYLIAFNGETATVSAVDTCETSAPAGEGRYCATSTQKMLPR